MNVLLKVVSASVLFAASATAQPVNGEDAQKVLDNYDFLISLYRDCSEGIAGKGDSCERLLDPREQVQEKLEEINEIYLKGFEIAIKDAQPMSIMTSYNLINGVQASENKDLLTGILRGEWDFKGMVTTDWWTHGEHYRETKAGNDIKMANGYEERVQEAFEKGYITRDEIALCAKRILTMILRMD